MCPNVVIISSQIPQSMDLIKNLLMGEHNPKLYFVFLSIFTKDQTYRFLYKLYSSICIFIYNLFSHIISLGCGSIGRREKLILKK